MLKETAKAKVNLRARLGSVTVKDDDS